MKNLMKRLFALLLVCALVGTMIPAIAAEPAELTDADYAAQEDLFAQIEALEDYHAKRGLDQKTTSEAAEALVLASDNYVEGSLDRKGDAFTWMTEQGIRCGYNPRMRRIREKMVAPAQPEETGVVNEPVATRGGSPSSKQVYLIAPFYGSDANFTNQYKNEAKDIAQAIGDTDGYTLYADNAATITNVAKAISSGAVVIFDSHGTTDYERDTGYVDYWGDPIYECVSGATNSYLCLDTKTGLTTADYDDGAFWDGDIAYVNGATIANHMTTNSPAGFLWMAICLGMATDTICQPMREMGVEVVYGYSQSVSFDGDYCFESAFWDNFCTGKTVAESIAAMKQRFGTWDWSVQIANYYGYNDGYTNISEARDDWSAFPVVVSDEDPHPGQRNDLKSNVWGACSLQTVKSTYTMFAEGETPSEPDVPDTPEDPEETYTLVTSPAAGKAYKLGMDRGDAIWYFNGFTESSSVSYRLDSTTDIDEAVDVYLEQAGSGYRLYFMNGSTKTYIRVFHYVDGAAGKGKGSLALVTYTPSEVFDYDTAANTLVYDYDGKNAYYMGCYNSYTAFSVSNTSYITGSNASKIGVTQFPAHLYEKKEPVHTHVYDNGDLFCSSCGQWTVEAGETAVLTDDLLFEQMTIPTGVTLDLNGHLLLVDNLVSFGQIIDTAGGAELMVTNLEMTGNEWLPILNSTGCYEFFDYELENLGSKKTGENVAFGFCLNFTDEQAYAILADDADLQIIVLLAVDGVAQPYAFGRELLQKYVQLQNQYPQLRPCLQLSLTGLDAAAAGTEILVTPMVSAVAGKLQYFGEDMTYTA